MILNRFILAIKEEEKVLDVGSGLKFEKKGGSFSNLIKNYKTVDINESYKPDIVGDIQNLPVSDATYDVVIAKAVFEHIPEPVKAAKEIYRVLKPGGRAYIYAPFLYPYHAEKNYYKDYFRFTRDGLEYIFKNFKIVTIYPVNGLATALAVQLPGKIIRKILRPLAQQLGKIYPAKNQVSGFEVVAKK